MEVETDWGLRLRLFLTLFLVLITTVFLGIVSWFLINTLATVVAAVTGTTPMAVLRIGALAIVLGVGGYFFLNRYNPEPLATEPARAENSGGSTPVETPASIENVLARLAQQVDIPQPTLRVLDSDLPNAYTGGYSPSNATIVVTTGLLDRLDEREIQAVLAHELVHVVHRDQLVITIAAAPLSIAWRLRAFTDEQWAKFAERGTNPFLGVGTVALFAVAAVFSLIGRLVVSIHSRYREFAADSGAVALTGASAALACALRKLDNTTVPKADMREAAAIPPVRAFISPDSFLDDEFKRHWSGLGGEITPWLDPHPTTDDRIDRLRRRIAG
jgi:heat shock protein HtpX